MSSPRTIEAGASRARSLAVAVVAAMVLACVPLVAISGLATAEDELKEAKHELHAAKDKVRARTKRIRVLQHQMDRLATHISRAQSELFEAERRIDTLERKIIVLQARERLLQAKLDERTREAYMLGGAPVLYLLTATSAAEAAARMSFLTEMNRRDAVLASKVQDAEDRVSHAQADVVRGRQIVELKKRNLQHDKRAMQRKMAESRRLLATLHLRVEQIQVEISRIRPFGVCPVAGPHAVADDFGILVHHPKNEGGNHIHQGNDIYAAMGTPIVAPFDGVAVTATNKIGGLAVKVLGDYGYVYNAHLSRFGKLGPVSRGDVIGYVGATGNAGGPHDHFEWHPGGGAAVDPHAFLMIVCSGPEMTF
jgi:murein DD-endopeptidase MepM/ murein hydrolase activator NlpD